MHFEGNSGYLNTTNSHFILLLLLRFSVVESISWPLLLMNIGTWTMNWNN